MNKEFVPHEPSLALKELGFDEPCLAWFSDRSIRIVGVNGCALSSLPVNSNFNVDDEFVTAPLYQQAFRWFREKYNKYGVVNIDLANNLKDKIFVYMVEDKLGYIIDRSEEYNTYEEAESACLDKLIELVKTK